MKESVERDELEACTFVPKINLKEVDNAKHLREKMKDIATENSELNVDELNIHQLLYLHGKAKDSKLQKVNKRNLCE